MLPTDTGCETIAINIIQFSDLDSMLVKINLAQLDSGNGNQSTFKELNARCHKSCSLKFGRTKLEYTKRK